jgi:hypothetical protein
VIKRTVILRDEVKIVNVMKAPSVHLSTTQTGEATHISIRVRCFHVTIFPVV